MGGVKVQIKARKVTVEGKLGKLQRDLGHINADLKVVDGHVVVEMWNVDAKRKATLRSALSAVVNLMNGVQHKYVKVLRLVYAHFPINFTVTNGGKSCEIRNFLGEKRVRKIDMLGDTNVIKSTDTKDEIQIEGIDIDLVGRSAALITQSCLVKNKDIRKFLDGIYVSQYGQRGGELKAI